MINKTTRDLLLRIITEQMIPEYKKSEKLKQEIRDLFLDCLDKYIDDNEKRLISEHPEFIKTMNKVKLFFPYSPPKDIKFSYKNSEYSDRYKALELDLGKNVVGICNRLDELITSYPKMWRKLRPLIQSYCCVRNAYIEKWNIAHDAITHKNMTITILKNDFPELYKLYRECVTKK